MRVTEQEVANKYVELIGRFCKLNLELQANSSSGRFKIVYCPRSNGMLIFKDLNEAEMFCRGYELGMAARPNCAEVGE